MTTRAAALAFTLVVSVSPLALAQTSGTSEPCFTQAQVIRQLESQGYSNIRLSELSPKLDRPRPDLSARTPAADAEFTTTHPGWNGKAVINGWTYDVILDRMRYVSTR
jgi:hypothetical protein